MRLQWVISRLLLVIAILGVACFSANDEESSQRGEAQYVHRSCQLVDANLTSISREVSRMPEEPSRDWLSVAEEAARLAQRVQDFRQALSALIAPAGAVDFQSTLLDDLESLRWDPEDYRTGANTAGLCEQHPDYPRPTPCTKENAEQQKAGMLQARGREMGHVFDDLAVHLPSADIWDLMNQDPYCAEGLHIGP